MDQARQVAGRSVVNYDLFKFRAVVDWIQIEFATAAPTNFGAVKRNCGLDYVKALNPGLGSAATIFRTRIQDPPRWHAVAAKLAAIDARFPFATPPAVTAIEVSFDAYGKGASPDELAEQACRFFKFQTRPVDKNRRFSGRWKGDVEGLRHYDRVRRMVRGGRVIAIGNKTDDRSQRVYFKTTDKAGKVALPENQWRARIELTLQGQCLPATSDLEWATCKFEQLYEFFNFREPKPNLDPMIQLLLDRSEQVGERKPRSRVATSKPGSGNNHLFDLATKADLVLNDKARTAIRELSRRWARVQ